MNERIRELLVQSGLLDYTKIIVPEHEKFAELIVRECLEVVRQSDDECYDEWDYADRDLCGIIKQHFGVEE